MLTRYVGVALTLIALACGEPSADKPLSEPALPVTALTIDSARAPRGGAPLIAGEAARIGVMIRDGHGPFRVQLRSRRINSPPGPPLLEAEATIEAGSRAEIALKALLSKEALSGRHQVRATVHDARGKRSTATCDVDIVGADATVWPDGAEPARVQVLDSLGRRRKQLVRGEPFTVKVTVDEPGPLVLSMRDARGRILASIERQVSRGTTSLALEVPRLARIGRYVIAAGPKGADPVAASFEVIGERFAPVSKLVVDSLSLYGGKDGRAPRKGILRLGEPLIVEARVGGARSRVAGRLTLVNRRGEKLIDVGIGEATVSDPSPEARVFVHGEVAVPRGARFPPGRYRIQVEVSEGDDVSMRTREVLFE